MEEEINENVFNTNFASTYRQTKYGLNWAINKKWNAKNRLKTGVHFDIYDLSILEEALS